MCHFCATIAALNRYAERLNLIIGQTVMSKQTVLSQTHATQANSALLCHRIAVFTQFSGINLQMTYFQLSLGQISAYRMLNCFPSYIAGQAVSTQFSYDKAASESCCGFSVV